jgi:ABC-type sugar transport system ATPase subunit
MKCLLAQPKVLLLDEPTRGVDIGAKQDIHGMLRDLAARGVAILLVTSEMDELFALSSRIVVMHRGRVIAEFHGGDASARDVLAAAMGRQDSSAAEEGG